MLLSDEAARVEMIDIKVVEYFEDIKYYLLSLIERLEEETHHRKRGSNCRLFHLVLEIVDQSHLVPEVSLDHLVLEVDLHLVPEDKELVAVVPIVVQGIKMSLRKETRGTPLLHRGNVYRPDRSEDTNQRDPA